MKEQLMTVLSFRMRLIRVVFAASAGMACGGCIYTHNTLKTTTGTYISDAEVNEVKSKSPTKNDVVKRFGQPDQTFEEPNGGTSLLYKSSARNDQTSTVFLFYDDHYEGQEYRRVFFVFDKCGTFKDASIRQ
jgi:outer membrane protein assembly factor BamE (lipoprotein component of BamABCDE complex)